MQKVKGDWGFSDEAMSRIREAIIVLKFLLEYGECFFSAVGLKVLGGLEKGLSH